MITIDYMGGCSLFVLPRLGDDTMEEFCFGPGPDSTECLAGFSGSNALAWDDVLCPVCAVLPVQISGAAGGDETSRKVRC